MSQRLPRRVEETITRFTDRPPVMTPSLSMFPSDVEALEWAEQWAAQRVGEWLLWFDESGEHEPLKNDELPDIIELLGLKAYPYRKLWQVSATALLQASVGILEIPGVVVHDYRTAHGRTIRQRKQVTVRSRIRVFGESLGSPSARYAPRSSSVT